MTCDISKVHTELVKLLSDKTLYVKGYEKQSNLIRNVTSINKLAISAVVAKTTEETAPSIPKKPKLTAWQEMIKEASVPKIVDSEENAAYAVQQFFKKAMDAEYKNLTKAELQAIDDHMEQTVSDLEYAQEIYDFVEANGEPDAITIAKEVLDKAIQDSLDNLVEGPTNDTTTEATSTVQKNAQSTETDGTTSSTDGKPSQEERSTNESTSEAEPVTADTDTGVVGKIEEDATPKILFFDTVKTAIKDTKTLMHIMKTQKGWSKYITDKEWRTLAIEVARIPRPPKDSNFGTGKEGFLANKTQLLKSGKILREYKERYTKALQDFTELSEGADFENISVNDVVVIGKQLSDLEKEVAKISKMYQHQLKYHTALQKELDNRVKYAYAKAAKKKQQEHIKTSRKEAKYGTTAGFNLLRTTGQSPNNHGVMTSLFTLTGSTAKETALDIAGKVPLVEFFGGKDNMYIGHYAPLLNRLLPPSMYNRIIVNGTEKEQAAFHFSVHIGAKFFKNAEVLDKQSVVLPISKDIPPLTGVVLPEVTTNPESGVISVEYVQIAEDGTKTPVEMKDADGNIQYLPNPISLLSQLATGKGVTRTTELAPEVKAAIKMQSLQTASDMIQAKVLKGHERKQFIEEAFGVTEGTPAFNEMSRLLAEGFVPEASFIQSAGKNILQSLHIGLKDNVDQNVLDGLISALGTLAVEGANSAFTNTYQEKEVFGEDGTVIGMENTLVQGSQTGYRISITADVNGDKTLHELGIGAPYIDASTPGIASVGNFKLMQIVLTDESSRIITDAASAYEYMGIDGDKTQVQLEPIAPFQEGKTFRGQSIEEIAPRSLEYMNKQMELPRYFTDEFKKIYSDIVESLNVGAGDPQINQAFYDMLLDSDEDIKTMTNDEKVKAMSNNAANKLVIDQMLKTFDRTRDTSKNPTDPDANHIPFYLPWDMTVSGRYMIDNQMLNPQNSKITRFITQLEDMKSIMRSDENGMNEFDAALFKAAAAQALDHFMDNAIDKKPSETVFAELEKKYFSFNTKTGKSTFPEGSFLKPLLEQFSNGEVLDFNEAGVPVNEKMHVYQLVAALYTMQEAQGKEFEHNLVLEMDAITSGMILTLLEIGTNDAMAFIEKGGIYEIDANGNTKYKNHQEFGVSLDANGEPNLDIYSTPADMMRKLLEVHQKKNETPNYNGKSNVENLIESFVIKGNNGKWRNLMKPLVMVYIYGASMSSIKKKAGYEIGVGTVNKALKSYADSWAKGDMPQFFDNDYSDSNGMPIAELFQFAYPNFVILTANEETGEIPENKQERLNPYKKDVPGESPQHKKDRLEYSQKVEDARILLTTILKGYNKKFPKQPPTIENATNLYEIADKEYVTPTLTPLFFQLTQGMQYKKLSEKGELVPVKTGDYANMTTTNMVLDDGTQVGIAEQAEAAYGKVIEKAFTKTFPFLDEYRKTLKSIEAVNFAMFKFKLKQELEAFQAKAGTETLQISKKQFQDIIKKIGKDGFGYTSKSINGNNQDYMKYDREANSNIAVDGNFNDGTVPSANGNKFVTNTSTVYDKNPTINVGANGVIDIHEIDAFLMSISDSAAFQNIYDAYIMGLKGDKVTQTHQEYNTGVIESIRGHDILGNAIAKADASISKLEDSNEMGEFEAFMGTEAMITEMATGLNRISKDFDVAEIMSPILQIEQERHVNLNKSYLVNHIAATDVMPGAVVSEGNVEAPSYKYSKIQEALTMIHGKITDNAVADTEYTALTEKDVVSNLETVLAESLGKDDVSVFVKQIEEFMAKC